MKKQSFFTKNKFKQFLKADKHIIAMFTALAIVISVSIYLLFKPATEQPRYQSKSPITTKAQQTTIPTPKTIPVKPTTAKLPQYPDEIAGSIITLKKTSPEHFFDYYTMFSDRVRLDLEFPSKITFSYVEYLLSNKIKNINTGKMICYNIFDNKVNKLVGEIEIREKNDFDPGQFGMWINENYWGGGRILEAIYLISKAYFDARPETQSYSVYVRPHNHRSLGAIKKFGFKRIGDHVIYNGKPSCVFEMYRDIIKEKEKERAKQ